VSAMFRALPARVVPVPVDARGLDYFPVKK
jgi:hypothetical protein